MDVKIKMVILVKQKKPFKQILSSKVNLHIIEIKRGYASIIVRDSELRELNK